MARLVTSDVEILQEWYEPGNFCVPIFGMVSSGDPNSKVVGDLGLAPEVPTIHLINLLSYVPRWLTWKLAKVRLDLSPTGSSFGTSKCGKNQQIIKYPHTYSYNIYRSKLDKLPDKALDAVLASQAGWLETWSLCGVRTFSKPKWVSPTPVRQDYLCGFIMFYRFLGQMFAQVCLVHLRDVMPLIPFSIVCLSCCVHLLRRSHRASIVAAHHSNSNGFLVWFGVEKIPAEVHQVHLRTVYIYIYTIRIYVQPAEYPFNFWKESFILTLAAFLKILVC